MAKHSLETSRLIVLLLMMLICFSDPAVAVADQFSKLQYLKNSLFRRELLSGSSTRNNSHSALQNGLVSLYDVTLYGADPTGRNDSTDAILSALSDAFNKRPGNETLITGVYDLGGAQIYLAGGTYTVSRPLRFPASGAGNVMIHGGTIKASDAFPTDGYLIDLTPPQNGKNGGAYNYEFVTLRDLLLDANFRGGGISITNSLRITIDNCYVTHFTTEGIISRGGHETYIHNSFLGQHITGGGDPGERNFSGTAITLAGNDNAVTDVVIFSAATGILISGQANLLTGVHCYNKATGFGGTGIYLKLPGLTQTRIVNCYMDYTGIVAEDPVQLLVANSFFLGDAYVSLKSVNGVIDGVSIVDNEFSGSNGQIGIVHLDQSKTPFKKIGSILVDRNAARMMKLKSTVARGMARGNGTSWTVDFNPILLLPNRIDHVQYSVRVDNSGLFPVHTLRKATDNTVVVESNVPVSASIYVSVEQGIK
uniref:Rhamnogalacturonase A/B/Epimerase-like pectate lyase domain-containing protein n=1 Tax=Kalanchoe fedtschenkoi TaxID=63787 RepID=A0A7N0T0Q5_KALFE